MDPYDLPWLPEEVKHPKKEKSKDTKSLPCKGNSRPVPLLAFWAIPAQYDTGHRRSKLEKKKTPNLFFSLYASIQPAIRSYLDRK